jgi:hypothetical protein
VVKFSPGTILHFRIMKIDPPSPSLRRGKQFFSELKRRKPEKVAAC